MFGITSLKMDLEGHPKAEKAQNLIVRDDSTIFNWIVDLEHLYLAIIRLILNVITNVSILDEEAIFMGS